MALEIVDTNLDNILEHGACGYKSLKHEGLGRKIEWLKGRFAEGLKIKSLYSTEDGTQGMIEYLPGEHCWRPVSAGGYIFIHCIFVGFKREYKGRGYGSLLLEECLADARRQNRHGVAVVTRDGPFMAGRELFLKNGFEVVSQAPPDFALLVKRFYDKAPLPSFKGDWAEKLNRYADGLTIFRSDQCPYLAKCVPEISDTAERVCGIKPRIVELASHRDAQESPGAFGVFGIVYNGKMLAWHPISSKRFGNIMAKELKGERP
ncbi:MAG: GNAT family N-acetyltransferase [Dehalococcoidales bacterium]|nr:GNAT family N-acetyltransferase [Dehalococcoidales bacterium]